VIGSRNPTRAERASGPTHGKVLPVPAPQDPALRARARAEEQVEHAEEKVARLERHADEVTQEIDGAAAQAEESASTAAAAADSATRSATTAAEGAQGAQHSAEDVEEVAERLHRESEELLAAVGADALVEGELRAKIAGVDEDNPFGRPGRRLGGSSPLRLGFGLALGALLAYELLQAVLAVRQVLVLVLISAFLAVGLDPAVSFLQRRMRRSVAVTLVMLAFTALFVGFVASVVPPVAHQVTQLVDNAPQYVADLQHNRRVHQLDERFGLLAKLKEQADKLPGITVSALGGVVGASVAVLGAIVSFFTVLILTLYFLSNLPEIKRFVYRLVPRTRRARVSLLSDEILRGVGGYVLGNLSTCVVAGVGALIVLLPLGVPYPVALALLVAITDLIPLVGATIGAAIVVLVAFLGAGTTEGLVTLAYFAAYQQFENYILVPRVMARTVDVSPLATVVAALVGGALLGIVGALLSIPVAAAIQLVLREVVVPRQEDA